MLTMRTLAATTCIAIAGTAHAAFVGLGVRFEADLTSQARALGGELADATVYRMYAAWDNDGNEFLNVFNVEFQIPTGGTLFQDTLFGSGQDLMPWPQGQIDFQPSLAFDTWVTVNGGAAQPDGDGVNFSGSGLAFPSGWFTTPPTGLGIPVQNADLNDLYTVLLGQFTIVGADAVRGAPGAPIGFGGITFNDAGGETVQGGAVPISFVPPSPGVASLFGLAGLTALRRRR